MEVKYRSNITQRKIEETSDTTNNQSDEEYVSSEIQMKYVSAGRNWYNPTFNGNTPCYVSNLPMELDIFDDIPEIVYKNHDARDFLLDLKGEIFRAYRDSELDDLVLSKLIVSELTVNEVVLDWVFNYFQMFFSFDEHEGNYWGTIMNNSEEGEFCNSVIKIRSEKRKNQVKIILNTAVMLIR